MPAPETFRAIAAAIGSRFFTMDVAQRQDDGAWQIVELGDAQVAGLPGAPRCRFVLRGTARCAGA
jgi:ATP-grasp domain, R2K clade family 3